MHGPRTQATLDAIHLFNEAFSRHDVDGVMALMTPGGHVRGVDVMKVRDGKVAEKLAYVKG